MYHKAFMTQPFNTRGVPRVLGVVGLSEQDEADLQAIATFNHKAGRTAPSNKPLKLTKPEEFHFATDGRLRGPSAAAANQAPAPAPTKPHVGTTKPQEFHFATDARLKSKDPSQGEEQEYVDFTRSLRSSTTSLVCSVQCSGLSVRPGTNRAESVNDVCMDK
ncbi:hypothetical protein E2C01_076912 [Portunus trituberculatus]|uniref:Uncharacterized protein n=1 Tax=Portunus trituberculatus TaxID=210409 RepID=A0A5B7IN77_PORTR|nr:hypothetical protein [Portunus trituberculatus]